MREGLKGNSRREEHISKEISDSSLTHLEKREKLLLIFHNRDESERELYWDIKTDVNSVELKISSFERYKSYIS